MQKKPAAPGHDGALWRTLLGALDAFEQGAASEWYPARRKMLARLAELPRSRLAELPRSRLAPWVPEADVDAGADELVVTLDLPGVDRRDLRVEAAEHELTVHGTRAAEADGRVHLREEQPRGRFVRRVLLPIEIKPEGAKATLKDGVLRVNLPRAHSARGRSVKVR